MAEEKKEQKQVPEQEKKEAPQEQVQANKEAGKERKRDRAKFAQQSESKATTFSDAVPGRVEEIVGRTGTRGEAIQIRCKVLEGRDANKTIRRNVRGPIQIGDIVMLRETEIEARPLSKSGRGY